MINMDYFEKTLLNQDKIMVLYIGSNYRDYYTLYKTIHNIEFKFATNIEIIKIDNKINELRLNYLYTLMDDLSLLIIIPTMKNKKSNDLLLKISKHSKNKSYLTIVTETTKCKKTNKNKLLSSNNFEYRLSEYVDTIVFTQKKRAIKKNSTPS